MVMAAATTAAMDPATEPATTVTDLVMEPAMVMEAVRSR